MFSGSSRSFSTLLVSPRKISRDNYGSANITLDTCTSIIGASQTASRKRPSISPLDYIRRPTTRPSFGPLSSTFVVRARSFPPSTTYSSNIAPNSRKLLLATITVTATITGTTHHDDYHHHSHHPSHSNNGSSSILAPVSTPADRFDAAHSVSARSSSRSRNSTAAALQARGAAAVNPRLALALRILG